MSVCVCVCLSVCLSVCLPDWLSLFVRVRACTSLLYFAERRLNSRPNLNINVCRNWCYYSHIEFATYQNKSKREVSRTSKISIDPLRIHSRNIIEMKQKNIKPRNITYGILTITISVYSVLSPTAHRFSRFAENRKQISKKLQLVLYKQTCAKSRDFLGGHAIII